MKKITPHLWFNTEAKEATAFYTTLFPNSEVTHITKLTGTPSGDSELVTFKLAGIDFMAISAGPYFTFNPAVSMFVVFDNEAEIDEVWSKLIDGGKALMDYGSYPWAKKYGWLQDKYGLSWQLSMSEHHNVTQKITPLLMFTQHLAGKAKEAITDYTTIFPNSTTDMVAPYASGEGDVEGYIKHARFTLNELGFMAMDSSGPHQFIFNEAISFLIPCDTQEEIDYYWEKLSAVPEAEMCGWCKDKYGVSWQISSTLLDDIMTSNDTEKINRVTQAFLKMKKFDIAELKRVADQA